MHGGGMIERVRCLASIPALAALVMSLSLPALAAAAQDEYYMVGVGGEIGASARVEASAVLFGTDRTAWVGDLWAGKRRGGLKLSWNRVRSDADDSGAGAAVHKFFVALDQGRHDMQRLALGAGIEKESGFAGAYLTRRLSGSRRSASVFERSWVTETVLSDGSRIVDTSHERTVIRNAIRAFDYGAGVRAGRYFDGAGVLLSGGGDYEWGRSGARQASLSMEVEKRVGTSPFSVALRGEVARHRDRVTGSESDERVWVLLRYRFGRSGASGTGSMVAAPVVAAVANTPPDEPPRTVTRSVTTIVPGEAEALFVFDSSALQPAATSALEEVVARIERDGYTPPIRVTGHTCDIGDANYNLGLSARRANSVAGFLVSRGIPSGNILAEGRGEAEPRHPNTPATRHLNRRVEIAYQIPIEREETVVIPAAPRVPAVADAAEAPAPGQPAWVVRALRSSLPHKETIAGYRSRSTRTTVETVSEFIPRPNAAPAAVDDVFFVSGRTPTLLNVLANDFDPDGDTFWIADFTQPGVGTVELQGDQLLFSPYGIFLTDFFSYTIEDPFGAQSSALVTLVDP